MAVSDTLIGTLFDGRYQVVRKLGAGGMANVYLAEDKGVRVESEVSPTPAIAEANEQGLRRLVRKIGRASCRERV